MKQIGGTVSNEFRQYGSCYIHFNALPYYYLKLKWIELLLWLWVDITFFDYYYPNICLQRYVDVYYAFVFCLKLNSTQLDSSTTPTIHVANVQTVQQ